MKRLVALCPASEIVVIVAVSDSGCPPKGASCRYAALRASLNTKCKRAIRSAADALRKGLPGSSTPHAAMQQHFSALRQHQFALETPISSLNVHGRATIGASRSRWPWRAAALSRRRPVARKPAARELNKPSTSRAIRSSGRALHLCAMRLPHALCLDTLAPAFPANEALYEPGDGCTRLLAIGRQVSPRAIARCACTPEASHGDHCRRLSP
jgi:hypothetical protein